MSTEAKAPWVCLDIETREGRPEDVIDWLRRHWWPQENLKTDTNLRKLDALIVDKNEKLALLDAAALATVQLGTPEKTLLLHTFFAESPRILRNAAVIGFGEATPEGADIASQAEKAREMANEKLLLIFLRDWLDRNCDEKTTIVGWNVKGFDLPRLRLMYLRHGLRLPNALQVRADVYDMMKEFCRHFSVDRVEFMKLAVALEQTGIASRKSEINGAMVGPMIRARNYAGVLDYALDDINEESELFLRMTGRSAALQ
jgi:hypothetical protein